MNKKVKLCFCTIMAFLVLCSGCSNSSDELSKVSESSAEVSGTEVKDSEIENGQKTDDKPVENETPVNEDIEEFSAEDKLEKMTLEEKVAQLFIITPEALTNYSLVTSAGNTTKMAYEKYPVGGIIYMSGNIVEEKQFKEMTENMMKFSEEISGIPIFLGIDEEGGTVARIANNNSFHVKRFNDMVTINGDKQKAHEVGYVIGDYLNEYGLNLDFAPVADVLTNSKNQVVANRSFGRDSAVVSDMVMEVVNGLHENGIYACIKHFPGHGATSGDTHKGYAYTEKTVDELKKSELLPFKRGIEEGIKFIMVSHIAVKGTAEDLPSSLSKEIVQDLLRSEMGFDGIVVTDAMNMGAIAQNYTSAQAAVMAVQAGCDIVLMPQNFEEAYKGILNAVKSGEISEERINDSVLRILNAKKDMQNMHKN